jgi:hypothetical protein
LIEPARQNNPNGRDLRAEAATWVAANPQAYALFARFALEARAQGRRFGVKLLTERVRWECMVTTRDGAGYKINNNYHAYIARKLLQDHPQLEGFLRFRRTRY